MGMKDNDKGPVNLMQARMFFSWYALCHDRVTDVLDV